MKLINGWSRLINRSFTLRTRLLAGFSALALTAILLLVLMRMLLSSSSEIDQDWRKISGSIRAAHSLQSAVTRTLVPVYGYALTGESGSEDAWRDATDNVDRLLKQSWAQSRNNSGRINELLSDIRRDVKELGTLEKSIFAGRNGAVISAESAASLSYQISSSLDELVRLKTRQLDVLTEAAEQNDALRTLLTWAGATAIVFLSVVLALLANASVPSRLVHLRDAVKKIATGQIEARVDADGRDEISALSVEFNMMAASLEDSSKEQHQRYSQLTNLYKISKAISTNQDIDVLLAQVLNQSLVLMGAETGSIMLVSRDGSELAIRAGQGLDEATIKNTRVKIGTGISGTVALTGEPLIIKGDVKDSRVPGDRAANDALSVPLIAKEKVIGVINANNRQGGSFDEDDLRFFTTLAGQVASAVANTTLIDSIQEAYFNTIKVLAAAIDAKDKYTHGHSERVAKYAVTTARQMGLAKEDLTRIEAAAYLHDIGKIGVPDGILNKDGPLTPEEMDLIKNHPPMAADILAHIDFPWGDVIPGVRGHHERFDGRGYPDGLKGYDIPPDARIIAVADTFDAMTSDRPYRKALDHNKAITELVTGRRGQFDQEVVDAFVPALLTTLMTSVPGGIEDQKDMEFSISSPPAK